MNTISTVGLIGVEKNSLHTLPFWPMFIDQVINIRKNENLDLEN